METHIIGTFVIKETGGEIKHSLSAAEGPRHQHETFNTDTSLGINWSDLNIKYEIAYEEHDRARPLFTSPAGESRPHENMSPYLVISIWKRIS